MASETSPYANADTHRLCAQLQLTYAPVLLFFPASADGKAEPGKYDFNRLGFDDTTVADFLSTQLGYKFPYSPPFPWGAVLTFSGACLVMAGAVLFVLPKLLAESSLAALAASGAKAVCMALSLGTIVIMCAGHMWNTIRAPPYMQIGSSGQAEYFAQGFQNQYAAETHIVAAFCACAQHGMLLRHCSHLGIRRCAARLLRRHAHRVCASTARRGAAARWRVHLERHPARHVQHGAGRVPHQKVGSRLWSRMRGD